MQGAFGLKSKWHNRDVIYLLFLCASIFILAGCNKDTQEVRIGLSVNLTGYSGTPAEDMRDGATLAVKEINKQEDSLRLRLITKDDKNSPQGVKAADEELIAADCPVIIGHSYSENTLMAYPIVTGANRILITAYTATTKLSDKDDLFFRTSVDNSLYAKAFAKLFRERNLRDIVTVMDVSNPSFSLDLYKSIKKEFNGAMVGISIDARGRVEWDRIIRKIKEKRPQAVLMATEVKSTAILAQKLKEAGYKGSFFATIWAQGPSLLTYGGHAVGGLSIVTFVKPRYHNKLYRHFERQMEQQFYKKATPKAARAYELVSILHEAIKGCKGRVNDTKCIKNRLLNGHYHSLMGPLKFNRFGDVLRPIYLVTVKGGDFHLEKRIL